MNALVAAIYADPDDLAARAVYADWLTERGDPLGELIALQLAGGPEKRIAQLIEKHGAAWAGAVGACFAHGRFEYGMFAGGELLASAVPDLADPAWATVRAITGGLTPQVLALAPQLPHVRAVHGLDARQVIAGPWEDVEVYARDEAQIRSLDGLVGVRRLGIALGDTVDRAWWLRAPVLERVERLVLVAYHGLAIAEHLVHRGGALRAIELTHAHWDLELTRPRAPGPWTQFTARPDRGAKPVELLELLSSLPMSLQSLVVEGAPQEFTGRVREYLAASVARFAPAVLDVPWLVTRTRGASFAAKAPLRERLPQLWDALAALGQRYDEVSVSRVSQPLDGLALVERYVAAGARVAVSGGDHELWISRDRCNGVLGGVTDARAAAIALVDALAPAWLTMERSFRQWPSFHPFQDAPDIGRVMAFRPELAALIPDAFPGVTRHAGYAIVEMAEPDAIALRDAMVRTVIPFDLQARVYAALGDLAGLVPRPEASRPWEAWYGDERDGLEVEVRMPTGAVTVTRHTPDDSEVLARGPLADLDAILARCAI